MRLYEQNLFYLLILLLLASCAVGPDFIRPAPKVSKHYTNEIINALGPARIKLDKIIEISWWKSFHSLTLNALMQQGIKDNYSLKAMQETLAEALEMLISTKGQLWPEASMAAGVGRQKYGVALFGPVNFTIPPFTYYEMGPSINYTLDIFGGTRRTIEKQQALVFYQQQELNAAFLTVTGNIATTSINIAALNSQVGNTREVILADKKNLHLLQKAFALGSATRDEILSAKAQLTTDEALLPPLNQQLRVAEGVLSVLIGALPANFDMARIVLKDFSLPDELPLTLPSELIHKRPDILASEAVLHAASADIGIATSHLYPNITLSATTLQESLTAAGLFNASANAWSLLGNLTTPIFNGGALRAQRRASLHAYQSAYANYQHVVLKAFAQVRELLYALKHDEEEISLQKKVLATTRESLRLTHIAFKTGSASVLDVTNAKRVYASSYIRYENAMAQRYLDTIQLYLALGGGIEDNQTLIK